MLLAAEAKRVASRGGQRGNGRGRRSRHRTRCVIAASEPTTRDATGEHRVRCDSRRESPGCHRGSRNDTAHGVSSRRRSRRLAMRLKSTVRGVITRSRKSRGGQGGSRSCFSDRPGRGGRRRSCLPIVRDAEDVGTAEARVTLTRAASRPGRLWEERPEPSREEGRLKRASH